MRARYESLLSTYMSQTNIANAMSQNPSRQVNGLQIPAKCLGGSDQVVDVGKDNIRLVQRYDGGFLSLCELS